MKISARVFAFLVFDVALPELANLSATMIHTRITAALVASLLWAQSIVASPIDLSDFGIQAGGRADSSLVGYLGAFFLGADPYVYFYLSNGNNAISFKSLNKGQPVIKPTKGTGGVRDPAIVQGGGSEAGKKWYIVGTDLDIAKVSNSTFSRGRSQI
jgi:hypothetical protein